MARSSVSGSGAQIMRALSTFRFLTAAQIVELGIVTHTNTASNLLRNLRDRRRPFVFSQSYAGTELLADGRPSFGRKPSLHQLSPLGAEYLAELDQVPLANIPHAKKPTHLGQDYHHLVQTIAVHVQAALFCKAHGATLAGAWRYYAKQGSPRTGNPLRAETSVPIQNAQQPRQKRYEPDLIVHMRDPNGQDHLFVVEVHRGQDKARLMRTLEANRCLLGQGQPQITLEVKVPSVCITLCEHPPLAQSGATEVLQDSGFIHERDRFAFAETGKDIFATPLLFGDGGKRSVFVVAGR